MHKLSLYGTESTMASYTAKLSCGCTTASNIRDAVSFLENRFPEHDKENMQIVFHI